MSQMMFRLNWTSAMFISAYAMGARQCSYPRYQMATDAGEALVAGNAKRVPNQQKRADQNHDFTHPVSPITNLKSGQRIV